MTTLVQRLAAQRQQRALALGQRVGNAASTVPPTVSVPNPPSATLGNALCPPGQVVCGSSEPGDPPVCCPIDLVPKAPWWSPRGPTFKAGRASARRTGSRPGLLQSAFGSGRLGAKLRRKSRPSASVGTGQPKCPVGKILKCYPVADRPATVVCVCVSAPIVVAGRHDAQNHSVVGRRGLTSTSGTAGDSLSCPEGYKLVCSDEGTPGIWWCTCKKGDLTTKPIITRSPQAPQLTASTGPTRGRGRRGRPGLLQHMFGSGRLRLGAHLRRRR